MVCFVLLNQLLGENAFTLMHLAILILHFIEFLHLPEQLIILPPGNLLTPNTHMRIGTSEPANRNIENIIKIQGLLINLQLSGLQIMKQVRINLLPNERVILLLRHHAYLVEELTLDEGLDVAGGAADVPEKVYVRQLLALQD